MLTNLMNPEFRAFCWHDTYRVAIFERCVASSVVDLTPAILPQQTSLLTFLLASSISN